MIVNLRSSYRGPYRNAFGGTIQLLDLPAGENDLSPEVVAYLRHDAPQLLTAEVMATSKEVLAAPVDKMVRKGGGLTTKNVFGKN